MVQRNKAEENRTGHSSDLVDNGALLAFRHEQRPAGFGIWNSDFDYASRYRRLYCLVSPHQHIDINSEVVIEFVPSIVQLRIIWQSVIIRQPRM